MKKITGQKETFQTCETKKRQKQKDQMVAGAEAIAGLCVVGIATTRSFFEYLNEKVGKKNRRWIAVLLFIFLFIVWAVVQRKVRRNAEKETQTAIKEIRKEIAKLKTQQAKASMNLQELRQQKKIVDEHYAGLQDLAGKPFRDIPEERQSDLIALVNDSCTLSEMLNKGIT